MRSRGVVVLGCALVVILAVPLSGTPSRVGSAPATDGGVRLLAAAAGVGAALPELETYPEGSARVVEDRPKAEARARASLAERVERLGADVSVAVLDVEDDAVLSVGDTRVQAASTIKVDIVAALLRARDGRPDRSERLAARAMITQSDNDTTDAMLAQVGTRAVNRLNAAAGVRSTRLRGDVWGRTVTTAPDRLRLLSAVLGPDSQLDRRGRGFLRSLMMRVTGEQRIGVDAAADRPGRTPLKAGYLPDEVDGRWYVSSMGEVQTGGRTYLVAVVSAGNGSLEAGSRRIERAARLGVAEAARLHEASAVAP